jgi:hypothetical protein
MKIEEEKNPTMEARKIQNSQSNPEQKEQRWRYHNTWLQTILQSHSDKNNMVLAQNQNAHQWNRIENPEISPRKYWHLIIDKGVKNIHWIKDSLFNMWCWKNWISTCKRLNLWACLSLYKIQLIVDQRP